MKYTICALIITSFLVSLCLGQGRVRVAISPVPLWPQDGVIPEELKNQAVFFNPPSNEIIVSLRDSNGHRTFRFELHNQTELAISSQVLRQQNGLYVYDYSIGVGASSKRPLKTWSLLISGDDQQLNALPPAAWRVERKPTQMVDKLASRHAPLMFVNYSTATGVGLTRGNSVSGFRLLSSYLPGYVTSFAHSEVQTELAPGQLEALPQAIANEIRRATMPEWDSKMDLAIGPRFAPGTPKEMIAESFHYAISRFATRGLVDKKSGFVESAIQALRSYLQFGRNRPLTPDQLSFLSSAQTPLEKEIANAMKLSLLPNP